MRIPRLTAEARPGQKAGQKFRTTFVAFLLIAIPFFSSATSAIFAEQQTAGQALSEQVALAQKVI